MGREARDGGRVKGIRALLAAAVAAASACSESTGTGDAPPRVTAVVVDSESGPIFRSLILTLERPATVQVDYWTAASPRLRVERALTSTTDTVFLPRLRSRSVYDFEISVVEPGGGRRGEPYQGAFSTESLPSDLSALRFVAHGTPSMPLVMLEVRTPLNPNPPFQGYVVVDADGEVVWYWRTIPEGFTRRSNGNFVVLVSTQSTPGGLVELTPDLRTVAELPLDSGRVIHHDVVVTPQNTLLFLEQETRVVNDTAWTGEAIWEWDPQRNVRLKKWSAFDFLSPTTDRGMRSLPTDWLHANSLALGPRGNVVVSLPSLNQIISIAPDFRSLEWRLGGPGSTWLVDSAAKFSFEHSAAEIAPGRVLLFDNGRDRLPGDLHSRALEIALDRATGQATRVWEFRPQPDIWAPIVGSARRLANGNTVVGFGVSAGFLGATGPVVAYEVTPAGRVVWDLFVEGVAINYRATPLFAIGAETEVREPQAARR